MTLLPSLQQFTASGFAALSLGFRSLRGTDDSPPRLTAAAATEKNLRSMGDRSQRRHCAFAVDACAVGVHPCKPQVLMAGGDVDIGSDESCRVNQSCIHKSLLAYIGHDRTLDFDH